MKSYLEPQPGAVTVVFSQLPDNKPQYGDLAGWDLVGNDIGNVPVHKNVIVECADHCISVDQCNAFTWTEYNGGKCWLKSSMGTVVPKMKCISGYVMQAGRGPVPLN